MKQARQEFIPKIFGRQKVELLRTFCFACYTGFGQTPATPKVSKMTFLLARPPESGWQIIPAAWDISCALAYCVRTIAHVPFPSKLMALIASLEVRPRAARPAVVRSGMRSVSNWASAPMMLKIHLPARRGSVDIVQGSAPHLAQRCQSR